MRRKSERSSTSKKSKVSPEKKVDKTKRTRTKRRKQSISSDNDSADEISSIQEIESVDSNSEPKELQACVKESEVEETHEQVWQVKAAEGSGDVGEIQKLKICLTRPPSTPEMVECSPHSKRKHSRTTSSSDTPSVEGGDERKKKKHHSKRLNRESKDETEKSLDSHDDSEIDSKKLEICVDESTELQQKSNEDKASEFEEPNSDKRNNSTSDLDTSENQISNSVNDEENDDANTTVTSSQSADICNDSQTAKISDQNESGCQVILESNNTVGQAEPEDQQNQENLESNNTNKVIVATSEEEVSNNDNKENRAFDEASSENKASNTNVLDTTESEKKGSRETSADSAKEKEVDQDHEKHKQELEKSHSVQSTQDECVQHEAVLVINRKRRWGSRPNKITTQKSITISTDILKEIIPDVKPVEFDEIIEEKKQHRRVEVPEKIDRPVLPKIVIDNTEHMEHKRDREEITEKETIKSREAHLGVNRKISIVKDNGSIITRPPSPPRNKQSCILFITNLVRPFTLPQLKNLLQRTGRIIENGFWIDKIKSKCFVKYETEDQAVETRHALHGVTWPVSNPKTLHVDFSTQEAFDKAKVNEDQDNAQISTVPGTVEDWIREQDVKRERGELEKPWERKTIVREWDVGKNGKEKEKDKFIRDDHLMEKRRHRTPERSPEPARKFKRKEEEAPAKLLDDLFRKTKSVPCIYWLPLSAETIAIKEEQRRKHMAEHERRMLELRRTQRRH